MTAPDTNSCDRFQQFLRDAKPRMLVIWGKNDPFFILPGAEAFRRHNRTSWVKRLDTDHFAFETLVCLRPVKATAASQSQEA